MSENLAMCMRTLSNVSQLEIPVDEWPDKLPTSARIGFYVAVSLVYGILKLDELTLIAGSSSDSLSGRPARP